MSLARERPGAKAVALPLGRPLGVEHERASAVDEEHPQVGIAALADDKIMPRYATATAEGRTSILQIDRARLIKAIYDDATLIFSIFKAMSRRARTLTARLVSCESNHGEDPPEPSE